MTEDARDTNPIVDRSRVRPYVLTGGRTRPSGRELPMETIVVTRSTANVADAPPSAEARGILALCQTATSIAEIAARLRLPLGVARVLVGDLAAAALVTVAPPIPRGDAENVALLERLLDGIRAL